MSEMGKNGSQHLSFKTLHRAGSAKHMFHTPTWICEHELLTYPLRMTMDSRVNDLGTSQKVISRKLAAGTDTGKYAHAEQTYQQ
eukprot:245788-Amphidinium_carterae.1